MPLTGKPSRGCETCRKRRVKCDENKPACDRCVKFGHKCLGYRDLTNLVFQHMNEKLEDGSNKKTQMRKLELAMASRPGNTANHFFSVDALTEDRAVSRFFAAYVLPRNEAIQSLGYLDFLPKLYAQSKQGSVLRQVVPAIAFSHVINTGGANMDWVEQKAWEYYIRALTNTNALLRKAKKSREDREEAMTATHLLGLCDLIAAREKESNWPRHVAGSAAVEKLTPQDDHKEAPSDIEMQMSRITAMRTLVVALSMGAETVTWPPPVGPFILNPAVIMVGIARKIAETCITIRQIKLQNPLICGPAKMRAELASAIGRGHFLDGLIKGWPAGVPESWRYREGPVPGQHVYNDIFICGVWNCYRAARIILHHELIAVALLKAALDGRVYDPAENESSRQITREMAREIRASVPYMIGDGRRSQARSGVDGQDSVEASGNNASIAGYYCTWQLTIMSLAPSVDEEDRAWARNQLMYIGTALGIKRAGVIAKYGPFAANLGDYIRP